ncbi:Rpn family recombination-promoting nuclease/putative transposase [Pseudanabaena sp. FACHB-1277]|uniref:Rpn family recombination-promoting nuclease/putative transposase n=1 Tax=Pseudanabaena cinerea FACHB-1277 TaxID=2949581 RepID=A0A926Z4U1_9CYAN|nr:Rpn family recombination-promoting nuclease/putative transposase [Pseudanabaena cinerea]MBD2148908.1 Rpn family recombination-promoting nuclease/putative transposase [Pseudanabaena cinerea FACHB-1277]
MFYPPLSGDRYINPLTDFGFKRLFGSEPNKNILIDFLNVILPPQHRVQDLTYHSTENLGNTPLDRKAIFDLYCQSEKGEKFIVEMQKAKHNYFKDRSIYYASFPIQEQAQQGNWNYKLNPVYTIGILDFVFDEDKDDDSFLHIVELKDQDCKVFYEKLKFIYLELPKFQKSIDQLSNHFEKWLFLLKHLPDLDEPPLALQENVFLQLFEVAQIAKFSQAEREAYENSLKYYRDMNGVIETARDEGKEEGRQEGRQEGLEEGKAIAKLEMARKLLDVLDDEAISQVSGLSVAEIAKLRNV